MSKQHYKAGFDVLALRDQEIGYDGVDIKYINMLLFID